MVWLWCQSCNTQLRRKAKFCDQCGQVLAEDQPSRKRFDIFNSAILAFIIGFMISLFYYFLTSNHLSMGLIFIFSMISTIVLILFAPVYRSLNQWKLSSGLNTANMLQINAAIITGIFVFLTISTTLQQITINQNQTPLITLPFKFILSMTTKSLIFALSALTLIPFAISSILSIVVGDQEFPSEWKEAYGSGTKLAAAFMIAGFGWTIITMLTLLYITLTFGAI
jgi:predicted nucleic acid-binding Zn ribbon protein